MSPFTEMDDPSLRPEVFFVTILILGIVLTAGWGLWEVIKAVLQ